MRTLEFEVSQQKLRKYPGSDFSGIVAGSIGYLNAKFHFSQDWEGCKKVASFSDSSTIEYPVLLDADNKCEIPREVLSGDVFYVTVLGAKSADYRLSTNTMKIKQEVL